MRKARFAFLFFVLLVFGFSLAVPAENLPETAYDESEGLPYGSTPLFSNVISQAAAPKAQDVRSAVDLGSRALFPFTSTRLNGKDASGSPNVRGALALLCILRC